MADFPLSQKDIRDFLSLVDGLYDLDRKGTVCRAKTDDTVWIDAAGISSAAAGILRRIAKTLHPQGTDPE